MTERSPSPLPPTLHSTQIHRPVPLYPSSFTSHDTLKIFRDTLLLTEGRDKVVKLLQYTSRLIVLLSSPPSKRLRPFISQMSMTRKVLKLGHGIFPYSELTKGGLNRVSLIRAILEIINDFWDDVYCLTRIGLLQSARLQKVSEDWANRAWMTGIIMDLLVLMQRREHMKKTLATTNQKKYLEVGISVLEPDDPTNVREQLRVEAYWIDISILKLFADFGFCGWCF
jgi:Peroxisomal biogenesis factor 11 (PEX11)